jgi:hypothetical protein
MYKIDKIDKEKFNQTQKTNQIAKELATQELNRAKLIANDLVDQDIAKLHLTSSKCPIYPNTYNKFFNENKQLESVTPYKITNVKHKRDGKPITKIEYNDFYSDKNLNKDVWLWNNDDKYMLSSTARNNQSIKPMTLGNYPDNKILKMYEQTRRKDPFATPLPTNGTNEINILFNDKCVRNTFGFRRYASEPVNNTKWFDNKLYNDDISQETEYMKNEYMDSLVDNSMNLYDSVFQDMYHMTMPNIKSDPIDKVIDTGVIDKIRRSY